MRGYGGHGAIPWGSGSLAVSDCWVSVLIHSNTFIRRGDIWLLVDGPFAVSGTSLWSDDSPLLLGVAEGGACSFAVILPHTDVLLFF